MRRAAWTAVGALVLAAVIAGPAEAKPPAATTVTFISGFNIGGDNAVFFGQVKSPKQACIAGRTVKFVARYGDASSKVIDSGRSSADGAISARYSLDDLEGATKIFWIAPKAKPQGTKCAAGKTPLT